MQTQNNSALIFRKTFLTLKDHFLIILSFKEIDVSVLCLITGVAMGGPPPIRSGTGHEICPKTVSS